MNADTPRSTPSPLFLLASVAALSACSAGSSSPTASTSQAATSVPSGSVTLVQVGSGMCLQIGAASGSALDEEVCNGSATQAFSFAAQAGGTVQIKTASGLCFTQGANNSSSIQLRSSACSASDAKQLFVPEGVSTDVLSFKTSDGVGCVDVAGSQPGAGAILETSACEPGGDHQEFRTGAALAAPPPMSTSTPPSGGSCRATTWKPGQSGGWKLSDGNLTAVSPDNGTAGPIYTCYAGSAIPVGARSYFEITASRAVIYTAFSVGVGALGSSVGNIDTKAEGQTITHSTFISWTYNDVVSNGGYWIYDPQDDADGAAVGRDGPAPPVWGDPGPTVLGIAVDRVAHTVSFISSEDGRTRGPFDISAIGQQTIYPLAFSWKTAGPVATINGGHAGAFRNQVPAGYVALDSVDCP